MYHVAIFSFGKIQYLGHSGPEGGLGSKVMSFTNMILVLKSETMQWLKNEHIYQKIRKINKHSFTFWSKNPISLTKPINFFAFLDPPRCQQEIDMHPKVGHHFGT